MKMKIIKSENTICPCCMEEHEVKNVLIKENTVFKDVDISFEACYMYCDRADEFFENEDQIRENDIRLKNVYREHEGLLTSDEIAAIREKYGITQSDLCIVLGWGGKTITRYESHQVQDKAHDAILKKLDRDPEWFIYLLKSSEGSLSPDTYQRYMSIAVKLYEDDKDIYLRKAIEASYARYSGNKLFQGNTELSLDKVVDVIRYFASSKVVSNLYKVKLMKLMWYADALSFKRRGYAITGLVYKAFPMGAVPIAHNSIIDLKGVPCEEIDMGEGNAYRFILKEESVYPNLTKEDISILDEVIDKLGLMTKDEIISFMHSEQAYIDTAPRDVIQFKYADSLQI